MMAKADLIHTWIMLDKDDVGFEVIVYGGLLKSGHEFSVNLCAEKPEISCSCSFNCVGETWPELLSRLGQVHTELFWEGFLKLVVEIAERVRDTPELASKISQIQALKIK